jgi:hypothetical protein
MVGAVKIGAPGSGTNTLHQTHASNSPPLASLGRAALATVISALARALVDNANGEEFERTRRASASDGELDGGHGPIAPASCPVRNCP